MDGKSGFIISTLFWIIFIPGLIFVFRKYTHKVCRRPGLGFGFFFSLFLVLGKSVQGGTGEPFWHIGTFLKMMVCFLAMGCVLGMIFSILYQLLENTSLKYHENTPDTKHCFWKIYGIMILCYLPCFLSYFPGCMSYDSWYITLEALGIIGYDNHHPFLHTLIWSIFAHMDEWLGIRQIGIILYTSGQLLIMTAIYAYVVLWLWKRKPCRAGRLSAGIYFAANPVFHIFTLLLTKDVLFSGCFLLWILSLFELNEALENGEDGNGHQEKTAILSLLCCLFRNNMIYVVLIYTAGLFLYKRRISLCRGLCASAVIYYLIIQVIYPSLGVAKGNVKEMLSVPLSQIAAVYQEHRDELGDDEEALVKKYIPDVEYYDRFFADPIKTNFNSQAYLQDRHEFNTLWLRLAARYPDKYMDAFLALNLPYWFPGMDSVREYIETGNYSNDYPVQRQNLLPHIYEWYEKVSENQAGWMHLPVFRQIYSIGMPVWVLLFFEIWFLYRRRKAAALTVPAAVLLWMTYMLGPVSSFRYVEPILLTYPVWIVLALERRSMK